MLLITCPWCGPREDLEFRCGGESHIRRPAPAETVSEEEWGDYMFTRQNPRGVHLERWVHVFGCRRWFKTRFFAGSKLDRFQREMAENRRPC